MSRIHSQIERSAGKTDDRLSSTITLAAWRLRQTWWLLIMASVGFVAAMIIACVVPLFTTVATSGSLQNIFQATTTREDFTLNVTTRGLSTSVAQAMQQQLANPLLSQFGAYQQGLPPLVIQEEYLKVLAPASKLNLKPFNLYATELDNLKPHLQLISGQWAGNALSSGAIEVMLTPEAASALHLSLGDEMTLQGLFSTQYQTNAPADPAIKIMVKLVGLFEVQSAYVAHLQGQTFLPKPNGSSILYTLLAPAPAFLSTLDGIAKHSQKDAVYSSLSYQLSWTYQLQVKQVQPEGLNDLINRLNGAITFVNNFQNGNSTEGDIPFPYVTQTVLYNPLPSQYQLLDLLQKYDNQISLISIPITVLALQIIALLLFFVSLLMSMLVDRQMATNALLSSRGASGRQIFWSLSIQGFGICLLGVVLGPLLALLIVTQLTRHVLPDYGSNILASTIGQPALFFSRIAYTSGGTLLAALLVMSMIIWQTSSMNVLTLRRETARVSRPPFWLRYYLDVIAAVIALSGYGVSLYLGSVVRQVDISTQDLILAPLTLVAPIFLLLGCLLLFLRVFPWLLRFGSWAASRSRGAATMLAIVQMARAPRQVIRMILLLSLTVSFAIFAQVFDASQAQRTIDISAYETGADFSGDLPGSLTQDSLQNILKQYGSIPGVHSASAGYSDDGEATSSTNDPITVKFRAVDSQTFGQTAFWGSGESSQPLPTLLARIRTSSIGSAPDGQSVTLIPVIVDQAMASQLGNASVGTIFSISLAGLPQATFYYQITAIVAHIPTVNTSLNAGTSDAPGGVIADYNVLNQQYRVQQKTLNPLLPLKMINDIPVNHLWLSAASDAQALASIRSTLNSSKFALDNLYDRRELINELQNDPFYLDTVLTLTIGALTAFILALIGNLLASWSNVRTRRSSFVVLRALGANSFQISATLLWEQGIIYVGSLLLGLAFGVVLAGVSVPVLVFANLPAHGAMSVLSVTDFYLLQHAINTTIVVPASLPLTFVALILVCALALYTMIRTALRPSISSELRLNED